MALPSEDSTCAICDDSEGENSNAIVFCDGCNLAVHQGMRPSRLCSHITLICFRLLWSAIYPRRSMALSQMHGFSRKPGGKSLYNFLMRNFDTPKSCVLCPNEGGAFKQTIHGEWVHLLCAIWVPETRVANEVFMEPITGLDKVSKQRWKLVSSFLVSFLGRVPIDVVNHRNVLFAASARGHVFNAARLLVFLHFMQRAPARRSS